MQYYPRLYLELNDLDKTTVNDVLHYYCDQLQIAAWADFHQKKKLEFDNQFYIRSLALIKIMAKEELHWPGLKNDLTPNYSDLM